MLSFFRRALSSWLVLGLLGLLMVAFIVTGVGTPGGLGNLGGNAGGSVATVGRQSISDAEVSRRVAIALDAERQRQPGLTMAQFIASGGVERTVDQIIASRAITAYARSQQLVASDRLVGGAIASIPAFAGPNGKFDRATFLNTLAQRRISEADLREDFAREAVTRFLLTPAAGGARVPARLAAPYAAADLQERRGQVATIAASAFVDAAPVSDAERAAFYQANVARYTIPERRVIRVARFDKARFDTSPSDAEIADYYREHAAEFAGKQTRKLTQVIVQQQAQAEALAAKVRGGAAMTDAARAIGLDALDVPATDKAAFARLTSQAVADAAFAAPKGSVAPIARSGLGYHIVRVDAVNDIAGRSLAQARGEIVTALAKTRADNAAADFVAKIEDEIDGGATFDEVVKKYALQAVAMPPVTAGGVAPDQPAWKTDPALAPVLRDAFQAEPDDDAAVETLAEGQWALYDLDRIVPATPRPLAAIRDQVTADIHADRAAKAARRAADAIAAAAKRGQPLAEAVRAANPRLPAPQPAGGRRFDLLRAGDKVPPPLALLFAMNRGDAKPLEMAGNAGWYVVKLDSIAAPDPKAAAALLPAKQAELAREISDEYAAQFVAAIRAEAKVKRNDAAIARLKRSLAGGGQ